MFDLNDLNQTSVLVAGDLLMDQFIYGEPSRISREAPVLIIDETKREINPGGAGNAAVNVSTLGGESEIISLVGNDDGWNKLEGVLQEYDICTAGIEVNETVKTAVKTRVMAGSDQVVRQQVVRIDNVQQFNSINKESLFSSIKTHIKQKLAEIDALLLSDYGLGFLEQDFLDAIIGLCQSHNVPVIADSRYDLLDFQGVTIATPNLAEAGRAVAMRLTDEDRLISAGRKIIEELSSDYLLLTRGKEGMTLFYRNGNFQHIPVDNKKDVYDVTGAGDTVAAAVALGLGAGFDVLDSVKMANKAAGIAVTKEGAAPVYLRELKEVVSL